MSDTMIMRGVTCAVLYVDSAAAGANNGSTPTDALTTLTAVASLAAATVYIVRRTNTLTWTNGTCTTNNTYVIGMPVSTDPQYYQTPAAVKATAWDSDGSQYPVLTMSAAGTGNKFTGTSFGIHRIHLKNPGNATTGSVPAMWMTGASPVMTWFKYTTTSYDLTTATSPHSQIISTIYFDGADPMLDNVYVEAPYNDVSTAPTVAVNQAAIQFSVNCTHVIIRNVTVWVCNPKAAVGIRYGIHLLCTGDQGQFDNITINLVENRSTASFNAMGGFVLDPLSGEANYSNFRNITCNWNRFFTGNTPLTVTALTVTAGTACIYIGQCTGAFIDKLTVDLSSEPGQYPGIWIQETTATSFYTGNYIRTRISNLLCTKNQSATLVEVIGSAAITLNIGKATVDTVTATGRQPGWGLVIGAGAAAQAAPVLKAVTVTGQITATGCLDYMEVTSWTFGGVLTNACDLGTSTIGGGLVYIATATISGTWTSQNMVRLGFHTTLVIDAINQVVTCGFTDTTGFACLYVNNNNSITGQWYTESVNYKAFASNTYRTGGASAAIKFDVKATSAIPIWLAPPPLPGKTLTPGSSGMHTFTFYAAYKGYSTFDPTKIRVFIQTPWFATGTKQQIFDSLHDGTWETDASTWNNDTGLTQLKLTMRVPVDRNEACYVRVSHAWFQISSYWYIDPLCVIT